jgi:hypothetical protein
MATRSEQFRVNEQRKHRKSETPTVSTAAKRTPATETARRAERARKKAVHALELSAPGQRPSRKSTRGGANRIKPDASFAILETLVKGSPEARFRKARAKSTRVRGSEQTRRG